MGERNSDAGEAKKPPAYDENSLSAGVFTEKERFDTVNILYNNREQLPLTMQPGNFDYENGCLIWGQVSISKPAPDVLADATKTARALGANDFRTRENASDRLASMGDDAMLAVIRSLSSKDPEIVARSLALLHSYQPPEGGLDRVIRKGDQRIERLDLQLAKYPEDESLRKQRIDAGLLQMQAYLYALPAPDLVRNRFDELEDQPSGKPMPFEKEIRSELANLIRLKDKPMETMTWSEPPGGLDPIIKRNEALSAQVDAQRQKNPEDTGLKVLRVAVGMNLLSAYSNNLGANGRSVFSGKIEREMSKLETIQPSLKTDEEFRNFGRHFRTFIDSQDRQSRSNP